MCDVICNEAVPFHPYCVGVATRTRNVSEYMLVLGLCLVVALWCSGAVSEAGWHQREFARWGGRHLSDPRAHQRRKDQANIGPWRWRHGQIRLSGETGWLLTSLVVQVQQSAQCVCLCVQTKLSMATSLRTSKSAMSSSDSLIPKTHPIGYLACRASRKACSL